MSEVRATINAYRLCREAINRAVDRMRLPPTVERQLREALAAEFECMSKERANGVERRDTVETPAGATSAGMA